MNIGGFLKKIGKGAAWPFNKIDEKIGEELAEKAMLATRAALAEAPILDDLVDGKEIEIVIAPIKIQLRRSDG
jgi:predicted RNase H-related nuclease YkuK (DUF458 family)